jgi:GNAT superfamily N-acetyltransferase
MARELMNPIGISHKNNLLVACDGNDSRELIGWAQIRCIGYAEASANSAKFEDTEAGSRIRKSSQSRFSIEQDVDEMMWEQFEDDPTPIPTGLASLPWSKEYRGASKAAEDRLARRNKLMQIELDNAPKLWELSSVYVVPKWRGKGVGTELVRQVLTQQTASNQHGKDVYALTLEKNVKWYEQFGFDIEEQIPETMSFEVAAGNAITKMLGERLVCIRMQL